VSDDGETKQQVREFYDQIGWQMVSDGMYQNARYEDLRPVAREYIHRCHLRVGRCLKPGGQLLLDAGSGPIQYPEYLTYSEGYAYRVCLDISIVALQEARKRLGERGLYVVGDVANLPFRPGIFEGVVSLHTLHHLAEADQKQAYAELYRVLAPGCSAAIVNGWSDSPLMRRLSWLVRGMEGMRGWLARRRGRSGSSPSEEVKPAAPTGTFVQKIDASWLKRHLQDQMKFDILVWRSVSVRFLRAVILPGLGGRFWLKLLFWLEERFPHFFGEKGQYPLVLIWKD
jgi:SAM-dependent methyltransferase